MEPNDVGIALRIVSLLNVCMAIYCCMIERNSHGICERNKTMLIANFEEVTCTALWAILEAVAAALVLSRKGE